MFTGIIEEVAPIVRLERVADRVDLVVDAGELARGVRVGDSVAVSGCCLTVTAVEAGTLAFQAVPETLAHTSLGGRRVGDRVNLERALRADARFGGHIVQGHVDDTGVVRAVDRSGDDVRMTIQCGPEVAELLVPKGSVAVDGVSLTLVDPGPEGFTVALIPHTLAATTLAEREPEDRVNLEADVLGKYVRHYLARLPLSR